MKKKHDNPYIYAGLTAVSVIAIAMIMIFIVFRRKELSAGLTALSEILRPFLIGSILAYLLTPICNRVERLCIKLLPDKKHTKRISEILGVIISAALALGIFAILILLIVPATFNSIVSLIQSVPSYVMNLINWTNEKLTDYPEIRKYVLNAVDVLSEKFESWTQSQLMPSIQTVLNGVGNSISIAFKLILNIVIGFIVSIYLLSSRKLFAHQGKMTLYAVFKPKTADMIYDEVLFADKMFSGFLRGKVVDSAIVGMICFIVLKLMNYQDAVLISVIIGVTNIIPFFGPFIGAIPSALLIFVNSPKQCLYFIIFILILQQFDGNILGPKCMGSNINLSAFWVLFSITLFGGIWGVFGMVIGVPLFAVIYDIAKQLVYYKLKKNGKSELLPKDMQNGDEENVDTAPPDSDADVTEAKDAAEKADGAAEA